MAQSYSKGWTPQSRTLTEARQGFVSEGSTAFVIEGIDETLARLQKLQTTRNLGRDLKAIMRSVIKGARKELMQKAKGIVNNDQRQAYRAIRSMVYKRAFGGNVNIITKKSRGKYAASLPPQHEQSGRGGNRRKRSAKTEQMMSYWGEDRGFILRWLNDGTKRRQIKTNNNRSVNKYVGRGHTSASLQPKRNGNRGSITGSHWFGKASQDSMYHASEELTRLIDDAIVRLWGGGALTETTTEYRGR